MLSTNFSTETAVELPFWGIELRQPAEALIATNENSKKAPDTEPFQISQSSIYLVG